MIKKFQTISLDFPSSFSMDVYRKNVNAHKYLHGVSFVTSSPHPHNFVCFISIGVIYLYGANKNVILGNFFFR